MEEQKTEIKSNLEIHKDENYIIVSVNPKIYPLDVIYSAAYVFLDRAYILIDGDPEKEVIIEMKPKDEKFSLETLGREFNNEMLNYSVYKNQVKQNEGVRNAIIQRALLTNDVSETIEDESSDESFIDDPEGIAIPWEEKYGKGKEKTEGDKTPEETKEKEEDINVPWEDLERDSDEFAADKQKRKDNKDKI